jgi:hypothetical protein
MAEAQRTWTELGLAVMAEINSDPSEDGRPMTAKLMEQAIERMSWEEPPKRLPMSPGLAIQHLIRSMDLPGVDRISYRNYDFAPYGLYGIQANYTDGRVRLYVLDRGHDLVVLASDLWPAGPIGADAAVPDPGDKGASRQRSRPTAGDLPSRRVFPA